MGEAMIDLCDPRLAQFGFDRRPAPFAAGQRAHPAEHALFGPPDEPDAPVAFDPVRDAMALRLRLLRGLDRQPFDTGASARAAVRSEEQTSELQSLMRTPYAVFCLKKKKKTEKIHNK